MHVYGPEMQNQFNDISCDLFMYFVCKRAITCYGVAMQNATVCSGHGSCLDKDTCVCNANFTGTQCQYPVLTTTQVASTATQVGTSLQSNNTQAALDATSKVAATLNTNTTLNSTEKAQYRNDILQMLANSSTLNNEIKQGKFVQQTVTSLELLTTTPTEMTSASTVQTTKLVSTIVSSASVDVATAKSVTNVISNLVTASPKVDDQKQFSLSIYSTIRSLSNQVIGQASSVTLTSEKVVIVAQREYGYNLVDKTVQATSNSFVTFPKQITSYVQPNTSSDVSVNVLRFNPYAYLQNASTNTTSDFLSISIFQQGKEILVANVSSPILFRIPAQISVDLLSEFTSTQKKNNFTVACSYWDVKGMYWSTAGCKTIKATTTYVDCSCTHLTDFIALITPKLNILTTEDIVTAKLTPDNMMTFIVICSVLGVYVVLTILLHIFGYSVTCITALREHKKMTRQMGSFAKFATRFSDEHPYIALVLNSKENFTRPQRLTVILASVLGQCCSNALSYGQDQENVYQTIASVIVADLVVTPFVSLFSLLFISTNKYNYMPLSFIAVQCCSKHTKVPEQDKYEDTPKEETKVLPKPEKRGFLDILQYLLEKLDAIGYWLDRVTMKLVAFGWNARFLFLIIIIGVSSLIVGFVLLLPYAYPDIVKIANYSMIQVGIACSGILLFVFASEFLFVNIRLVQFNKKNISQWRPPIPFFIILSLQALALDAGIVVAVVLLCVYNLLLVFNGIIILIAAALFTFSVLVFFAALVKDRKPMDASKHESEQALIQRVWRYMAVFRFPWYFQYLWYLLTYAYIAAISYVLVIYGIKFQNSTASKWLLSSGSSVLLDIILVSPLLAFGKIFLVSCLFTLFYAIVNEQAVKMASKVEDKAPTATVEDVEKLCDDGRVLHFRSHILTAGERQVKVQKIIPLDQ